MSITRTARIKQVRTALTDQFVKFVQSEMERRKLTQKEFAKELGLHSQAISRLFHTKPNIQLGTMISVYDALGFVPVVSRAKRK